MASPPSKTTSTSSSAVSYPFPSEVNVANFVPLKLGAPSDYFVWKQLMLNLIESHELEGFVDGTIQPPPFPEQKKEEYRSWKRTDGLVRAWLFVTVTEQILRRLVPFATAREAWIALEKRLTPPPPPPPPPLPQPTQRDGPVSTYEGSATIAGKYLPLYKAIVTGNLCAATRFLEEERDGIRDPITLDSETALMVAVRSSKRNHIVKKLIAEMSEVEVKQRDVTGETALYKAVKSSNYEAVQLLVAKNRELPKILSRINMFPVHRAAMLGNREMVVYLLEATSTVGDDPNPFEGQPGLELLNCLALGGLYDIASNFLQCYPKLASMEPSPLLLMAPQHSSFRSRTHLNFFESLIYSCIPLTLEGDANGPLGRDDENSTAGVGSALSYLSQRLNATVWDVAEKLVPRIKSVREKKLIHRQALNFVKDLCEEVVKSEPIHMARGVFREPMVYAASLGICEIVEKILEFTSGVYLYNTENQNFFHVAIGNRQENVFNLIFQLEKNQQDHFLAQVDRFGNNPLHMVGNLGHKQQLSLRASVACPALQMQRELQWFKAVEKLLHPSRRYGRNSEGKTPQDVFTATHKNLVENGEKWMKDTASSCTIVAALIVTVVFAAAITVPGGINGNGLPIFLEDGVFFLFGMFDALALFSSTTSLLMFLSIFTSRYGEQDFLYSLPRKLIIGLVTLFLSVISMMIAFGATLKIVFGHKSAWVVIPVVVLSSVPITLFALLQFPLLLDIIRSTYYPGIFRKRSNRILY